MKYIVSKSKHPDKEFTDNYYHFYQETIYNLYYYRRYIDFAKRWNSFLNGVVVVFSLSAFSGLWLWETAPKVWAIIVAIAQGISSIAHLLPFQRQVDALNTFLPQLDDFVVQVEKDWYSLSTLSNEKVLELTTKRKLEYRELDKEFLGKVSFFERKRFSKDAENSREKYNSFHGF